MFVDWDAATFCDVLTTAGNDESSVSIEEESTTVEEAADKGGSSKEKEVVTISFVGDSTTFQHYSSIALLLG